MQETPLRICADLPGSSGTRLLRAPRHTYADGAEARILEILQAATDVSTHSEELAAAGRGWAERYHLSPQRGVILEFLDIPSGAKVLEIGAGCGPITRHLGERGAIVDAVEPMPARAAANRERCRDLPGVEIFVGELDDVPAEPAYDLVVIVGVLEYVGGGLSDPQAYLDFLRGLAGRLLPGGQLALAIENQLGVKYLAGSAEDHTNRIFDGIEGYPRHSYDGHPGRGVARTFARNELTHMIDSSGFAVDRVLAAFPDYKLTRAVLDSSLDDVDPTLAYRIPQFPSADHVLPRPEVLDEFATWRTLVKAGLAWEFPNSFLVCAHVDGGPATLWPDGQYAGFATLERRSGLAARTRLVAGPDGPLFRRHIAGRFAGAEITAGGGDAAFVPGRDLLEVLAGSDDDEIDRLLHLWGTMLEGFDWEAGGAPIDALPHNLIVTPEGTLTMIDDELRAPGWSRTDVLARGIYWTAAKLGEQTAPDRWQCSTVAELAWWLGRTFPELSGDWLGDAVRSEAALQRVVLGITGDDELEDVLGGKLATPLSDLGLGHRTWDRAAGDRTDRELAQQQVELLRSELGRVDAERQVALDRSGVLAAEMTQAQADLARTQDGLVQSQAESDRLQRRLDEEVSAREHDAHVLEARTARLAAIDRSRAYRWSARAVRIARRGAGPIARLLPQRSRSGRD